MTPSTRERARKVLFVLDQSPVVIFNGKSLATRDERDQIWKSSGTGTSPEKGGPVKMANFREKLIFDVEKSRFSHVFSYNHFTNPNKVDIVTTFSISPNFSDFFFEKCSFSRDHGTGTGTSLRKSAGPEPKNFDFAHL